MSDVIDKLQKDDDVEDKTILSSDAKQDEEDEVKQEEDKEQEKTSENGVSSDKKNETESSTTEEGTDGKDYNKIMESYQEKFNIAYLKSQALWKAEKAQRQALYEYQRKVNALLDLLNSYEQDESTTNDEEGYKLRIENLLKEDDISPGVRNALQPLLEFDDDTSINKNHRLNLYISEIVPEVIGDEVDHLEVNPQDAEAWVRRHFPHLVVSKFKPATVSSTSIQNSTEAPVSRPSNKRRRKAPVAAGNDIQESSVEPGVAEDEK